MYEAQRFTYFYAQTQGFLVTNKHNVTPTRIYVGDTRASVGARLVPEPKRIAAQGDG